MNEATRVPEEAAPNAGQDVDDATEPAEEYELDQLTDERDETRGESLADQPEPGSES